MFRNQYDGDITIWSPEGRLYQIEYAMKAVKQGSACVGLKSKTHAIDDHLGIAIAGLTSDARVLCKYMRTECMNHKYIYDSPLSVGRLVLDIADKSQKNTQRYGRRPYGVGMLVVGYDQAGAHLYETCPSGNYFEYKAIAIGARSQSAKTYFERMFEEFENDSLEQLIRHGLIALRETIGQTDDTKITSQNIDVGIVGEHQPFEILKDTKLKTYLEQLDKPNDGDVTITDSS